MRLRSRPAFAVAFALVAWFGTAGATIVDDINPQGRRVLVTVVHDTGSLTGRVRVTAVVGGKSASEEGTYTLKPGGQATVSVDFGAAVDAVTEVSIIEDADPIH